MIHIVEQYLTVPIEVDQNMNTILDIPSEGAFRAVESFIKPTAVRVSDGGEQYVSVSPSIFASLTWLDMNGSLLDAPPMADEAGYEYRGTSVCMVGGPATSITDVLSIWSE